MIEKLQIAVISAILLACVVAIGYAVFETIRVHVKGGN